MCKGWLFKYICVYACILTLGLVKMFTFKQWTLFEIRIQKIYWTWESKCQAADRLENQSLDSPSDRTDCPKFPGRGSSGAPSWTVCDRQLSQAEAEKGVILSTCPSSLILHKPKVNLVVSERTVDRNCAWTVREISWDSIDMSSSRYFKIPRNLFNLLKFGIF